MEVGAEEWRAVGFGEWKKVVSRDNIEKAVKRLMGGSDEAENIRRRAQEFGMKAKEAVQDGGSSHHNLTVLINDLKRLRDCKIGAPLQHFRPTATPLMATPKKPFP